MGDEGTAVAEWAVPIFGEEAAKDPNVVKYKDPGAFYGGFKSAVERVGKSIVIPDEKAAPEEWKAFRSKLGVPDAPEGYELKAPEKLHEGAKATPEIEKAFKAYVHKHNLTKAQAEGMYPEFLQMASTTLERQEAATKEKSVAAQTALKQKWGADYDNNVAFAQKAAEKFLTPEMAAQIKDRPDWIEHFNKIGKAISEDMVKSIQAGGTGTVTEKEGAIKRIAEIKDEFLQRKGAFYEENHPKHQEAVQEWTKLHQIAAGVA